MCGGSTFKYQGREIDFYLGYHGGAMSIDGDDFDNDSDESWAVNRPRLEAALQQFQKDDLVDILVLMVENAYEA